MVFLTAGEIWDCLRWITGSSYPLEGVSEQNVKQRNPLPLPFEFHANLLWKLGMSHFLGLNHSIRPPGIYFH